MKKIYLLFFAILFFITGICAQTIVVTGADGTTTSGNPYSTLGAAFSSINASTQAGNVIVITITGNTTETVQATINQGNWTSLTILPVGSASVNGNLAGYLIDLNGADNVTINGLNTNGNSLTIDNANTGNCATIRFANDATNNTIIDCNILGSSASNAYGTIFFAGGATTTGNDTNTITECNISASSGGTPATAVLSVGTSALLDNSNNTISNNNISDYFTASSGAVGINANMYSSGWLIISNTFYQTITRIDVEGSTHHAILVTYGSGYIINNNVIGYATPNATGTTNMIGLSSGSLGGIFPSSFTPGGIASTMRFCGITCSFDINGAVSSIQGNTIGGIAIYTGSGASTANGILCGIQVTSGNADIGTVNGNIIGSVNGTNSIYAASAFGAGAVVSGIYCTTTNTIRIYNNIVGGINVTGTTSTAAAGFKGIDAAGTGTYDISNNTIGSSAINNIRTGYLLTAGNLSNTPTTSTSASGSNAVQGILCSSTGATANITNNILRGFQISGTATTFTGINTTGAVTGTLDISFNNLGTPSVGLVNILFANNGQILCQNNSGGSATCAFIASNNTFTGINYSVECNAIFRCMNNSATMFSTAFTNNNFNNITINSSAQTFGFLIGATSNTPTVLISNNYVTTQFTNIANTGAVNLAAIGCASPATATGSSTITNNTLSNITVRTTSFASAIYWANGNVTGTTHNINISDNTVSNLVNNGSAVNASLYAIYAGLGNNNIISGNTVNSISGKNQVIGIFAALASLNNTGGFSVSNNHVSNINTTSNSSQSQGIQVAAGPVQNIFRNKIYDITCYASGSAFGLVQTNAAGTINNIYNNIIGRIYAPNSGVSQSVRGISLNSSVVNTTNIYYNTVYLDGIPGANSYCLYVLNTLPVFTSMNNIFCNNASASNGYEQFGMFIAGALSATYSPASGNNIIYAGTPGPLHLLYGDGATGAVTNPKQTLAAFQAFVTPRETYSQTESTPFLNTTNGMLNSYLHVNPSVASLAESGAVNIGGFTNDYDAEVRQANGGYAGTGTAPDIGADEMDNTIDRLAPDILYTPINNTTCLTNPTLSAAITDASGIDISMGTKPRLYFKTSANINSLGGTNTNTTDGWKYVEAVNTSSPYSFTINYSLIFGGVSAGTTMQYFITAQDITGTPNVAITTGVFASTPSSVALTGTAFPITGFVNSYEVRTGIPASITIGTAGTYTSLTGVNGLFADINSKGISANTVVNIIDASVTESGLYALNQIANGCSPGAYFLTIKPDVPGTIITGSVANQPLLRIRSSNVIIDGSFDGNNNRDMTITNTSATLPSVVVFGSTGTTPIINSTLKNCVLTNGSTSSSAVIVSDGLTPGQPGYFANITIENNNIGKAFYGIFNNAVPLSGNGSGLNISSNNLNNTGTNNLRFCGVYLQGVDGAYVRANQIGNFENAINENDIGVWLAASTVNTTVSTNIISNMTYSGTGPVAPTGIYISSGIAGSGNVISENQVFAGTTSGTGTLSGISLAAATSGITINGNTISNLRNTNAAGYGANGIWLASALTSNAATVTNNMIYGITGNGFAGGGLNSNGYGIVLSSGGGYNIYYNTVNMNTNQSNTAGLPAAVNITSGVTASGAIDMRNNIFVNTQTTGTERYAIYCGAVNSVFSNIDYNDYYSTGSNIGFIGSNRASLADMQTGFGGNSNSLNVLPGFVGNDLHLIASGNCALEGAAIPIAGIVTDIDAQIRNPTTPDIGMDEFNCNYNATLAGITAVPVCENRITALNGTTYTSNACDLIARLLPSGTNPVAGKVNTCVTLDAAQQYFNGEPYVQRHFDIEPSVTPSTSTATVTLYFTNVEFAQYNANNPAWPPLPTAGAGNTVANRNNVKVTQFHGVASTLPSSPGNYPGTRVLITPGAANVFWNGNYWEVTFNVSGFSGLYVHTTLTNSPLPIVVNYLNGRRQGSNHLLNWKVTCASTSSATMTLERSSDSRNFSDIYSITVDAARCNSPFDYIDSDPLKGMNYYRIKAVDIDGKVSYSTTVALLNAVKGFDIISIAPNPVVSNNFKLNVASAVSGKMEISIFDMQGRIVHRQELALIAGYNSLQVNVGNFSPGSYIIKGSMADNQVKILRFVKQ